MGSTLLCSGEIPKHIEAYYLDNLLLFRRGVSLGFQTSGAELRISPAYRLSACSFLLSID